MVAGGVVLPGLRECGAIRAFGLLAGFPGDGDHRAAILLRFGRMRGAGAFDIGEQILALLGVPDIVALDACGGEDTQPEKLFDRQYAGREQHG